MRMGIAHSQHRVYRSVSTLRGALFATALMPCGIVLAVLGGRAAIVGYALAPLGALMAAWAWRAGVHVHCDGVKIVGILSRKVRWEDIERFEVRPWQRYPFTGYVVLSGGGRAIPIMAITTAGGDTHEHRAQAQKPIDELNALLEQWRVRQREMTSLAASSSAE